MTDEETGFSREYVENLRKEAAGWRTKYRDLETSHQSTAVEAELGRRGIKADPTWVNQTSGMTTNEAVEDLLARFPSLTPAEVVVPAPVAGPTPPKVQTPGQPNSNQVKDPKQGRSLTEIKGDPVARAALRDRYRALIQETSRQRDSLES